MYKLWKRLLPPAWRNRLMIAWYDRLARWDKAGAVGFLNHGYAPDADEPCACIRPEDASDRYGIELYDLLARHADWRGARALEYSSGLGGGACWLARAYGPARLVGLDIAPAAVAAARRRGAGAGNLSFVVGDAEAPPFPDASFDIVLSVESSLNYPDFPRFLAGVDRILAPGGVFLIADYRSRKKRPGFEESLQGLGYQTAWNADLTEGVVRAHTRAAEAKAAMVDALAPWPLRSVARRFADLPSDDPDAGVARFRDGRRAYLAFALRKPRTI